MVINDDFERQNIVNELDSNLLVSASAGSGKTYMLVERMISVVERKDVPLSKMAALTFTKKAADEFYDRFYKKLQLRVKPDFNIAKNDEYTKLGHPTPEGVNRDKIALKNVDTCFFGTIDSFYQKILNEHPFEAGLSCSATILDDEEFELLLTRKFAEYEKSSDKEIAEGAYDFSTYVGARFFPQIMSSLISNKELDIDEYIIDFKNKQKNLSSLIKDFKKGCEILYNKKDELRKKKNTKDPDGEPIDYSQKSRDSWDYLIDHYTEIINLRDNDYVGASKIFSNIADLKFNNNHDEYFVDCDFISKLTELPKRNDGSRVLSLSCETIRNEIVFAKINSFLIKIRDTLFKSLIDEGKLTFSIATYCLLNLLRDEENNRKVIEQIRSNIQCLYIDECQDTDIKQYEIFFRLAATDFNSDFTKLTIPAGRLYICGDRKQSIYHFRGADVSTFDCIKSIFEKRKSEGLPYKVITLVDNKRSSDSLKQYFDKTFNVILKDQDYLPIGSCGVAAGCGHHGAYFYETKKIDDPENVAKIILYLKDKYDYHFSDFMVMVTSKNNISEYSKVFTKYSIPWYAEGKIDVHITSLIENIINLFKYIASNKTDTISLLSVLYLLFKLDISSEYDMKSDYLKKLFPSGIDKFIFPSELLEYLVSNSKIIETLGIKGIEIIFGFIHLLKEKENNGEISSYGDAIKYFTDLQEENLKVERLSMISNSVDAVQIANAHKTKGLEKKVVILAQSIKKSSSPSFIKDGNTLYITKIEKELPNGNRKTIVKHPEIDITPLKDCLDNEKLYMDGENKRLVYVAATRAREMLIISKPFRNDKKGGFSVDKTSWWNDLLTDETKLIKLDELNINNYLNFSRQIEYESKGSFDKSVFTPLTDKSYEIVTPSKINSPSKFNINEETPNYDKTSSNALIIGSMVHKLLEYIIKNAKSENLDDSICEYIAYSFVENNCEISEYLNVLKKVKDTIYSGGFNQTNCPFNDVLETARKSKSFLTETPFSFKENDKIVSGNIDLILEMEHKVYIIDYKTDVSEQDHSAQLNCYKDSLIKAKAYEGKDIETYIYLINKNI